jgi:hypothetical protein
MLSNTITVQNDLTGTPVDQPFRRFEESQHRTIYISTLDHSLESRHTLTLSRTLPTRTGNYLGTGKPFMKLTKDISVAGADSTTTVKAPLIGDIGFSIPVGASDEDKAELYDNMVSLLNNTEVRAQFLGLLEV